MARRRERRRGKVLRRSQLCFILSLQCIADTRFAGDAAMAAGVGGAGVVPRRRLTYNEGAGADQGWRAMAMPVFQGRQVTVNTVRLTWPPVFQISLFVPSLV
jgi:hypothetical protein